MKAKVTIQFSVASSYQLGDYARLCSNGGSGSVDYDNPITPAIDMFPNRAGIYGFGHCPWGHFRFGHAQSSRTAGFGHLPWGHFPFGYGTSIVRATFTTEDCGTHTIAFACYDKLGNRHEGSPEELTYNIHLAPDPPSKLKPNTYNKTTDQLTLDAA